MKFYLQITQDWRAVEGQFYETIAALFNYLNARQALPRESISMWVIYYVTENDEGDGDNWVDLEYP